MTVTPTGDDAGRRARYARVTAVFDVAVDMPAAERAAYVDAHCDGDASLAAEVRTMLDAHDALGSFLDGGAVRDPMLTRAQAAIGARYRLIDRIATGGMATVYRADDVRHARTVAIKVFALEEGAATGGVTTASRFLDEIRVTAGLQHPNVMPLFDSGSAGDMLWYVMPFVPGETLRARLRRAGALPIGEALDIARGIAGGLEHAHAAGVVHRDLKPENIILREGTPLICDFGIALVTATLDAARLTESGTIVGTPQYMSPEQALASAHVDARTDVYSLGAMLYEMLLGDPPFPSGTPQRILARVLSEVPTALSVLQPTVGVALSNVVARAMSRRPEERYQSVRALRDAVDAAVAQPIAAEQPPHAAPVAAPAPRSSSRTLSIAGIVLAGVAGVWLLRSREPVVAAMPATRFAVAPLPDAAIGRAPTLTPDGTAIVYAGAAESGRRIFVRRVNELEAHALDGTHGALATTISPDGKRIAFTTSDDRLMRIGIDGSELTDLGGVFRYSNVAWLNDDEIVFDTYGERGLAVLSASGGASHAISALDTLRHDTAHLLPLPLDDGKALVFVALRDRSGPGMQTGQLCLVRVGDRGAPQAYTPLKLVARGAFGFVDGWLLYVRGDGRALMAVRFDPSHGEISGAPITVLDQEGGGIDKATLARNGTLLYSRLVLPTNAPVVVDSTGTATPVRAGLSGAFMNPRVSHDGRRIVVQRVTADGSNAWLYDLATGTESRITGSGAVLGPAWSADDRDIVYVSSQEGRDAVWTSPVDASRPARRVVVATGAFAASPSNDPRALFFQRRTDGPWSIWRAGDGQGAALPVLVASHDAFMPTLSPDDHWLAWAASESGRYEVYVQPFPGPGATLQVSSGGGTEPAWSSDGATLFYRVDRRMMAATLSASQPRTVTQRRALFADSFDGDMPMPHRNYDVIPGGRGFVMIAPTDARPPETVVVLNWLAEFRAKVAAAAR